MKYHFIVYKNREKEKIFDISADTIIDNIKKVSTSDMVNKLLNVAIIANKGIQNVSDQKECRFIICKDSDNDDNFVLNGELNIENGKIEILNYYFWINRGHRSAF